MPNLILGGGPADIVVATMSGVARPVGPAVCTLWDSETGGTQYDVPAFRLGSEGRIPPVEVTTPDGVFEVWVQVQGIAGRYRLHVQPGPAGQDGEDGAPGAPGGSDAETAQRLESGPLTKAALASSVAPLVPDVSTGPEALRALILSGGITPSRPMVIEGDSHAGGGNAPDFGTRLITPHGNPGRDLEGLVAGSVLPSVGNDGITPRQYIDQSAGQTKFDDVTALKPSACLFDIGTNAPRLGQMGTTVASIRDALTPQYVELIDKRRAASPDALIVFRIPSPVTTVATPLVTIDPQVMTTAIRQAMYAAARMRPGTLVYDPQVRLFGTTSPTSNATYYADAIHLNQAGYFAMADDFAAWVGAARPRSEALAAAARSANPTQPWANYHREVEDTTRYALVAESIISTDNAETATFLDIGPSFPSAMPGAILRGDLVEVVDAQKTVAIPSGAGIGASAANTRISNWSGGTGVAVARRMLVRIWRRRFSTDATVNGVIADPSWRWKVIGRVGTAFGTGFDVNAISTTTATAITPASEWVAKVAAGDRLYIEGQGGTYIELAGQGTGTNQASVFGAAMRITTGASGAAYANAMVVLVSSAHL